MFKNSCFICKIFAILVIIGAVNWGIIAAFQVDYISKFLSPVAARIVYGLVGISGLAMLVGCFVTCKCHQEKKK